MKTTDEMLYHFKMFTDNFKGEEKKHFSVHSDYLIDKMTEDEFNQGYNEYRKLMLNLQNDMCDKPHEYGLIKYDKNNNPKPACLNPYPYLWLFLALSLSGEIKEDILYVNSSKFIEYANGKPVGSHTGVPQNIDKLISKLNDFNIMVDGYIDGKQNDFTVYSKIPRLLSVIKASTLSQYAQKSMMSDYVTFNDKIYAIGMKEQIKIEDTHTYKIMPVDRQQFASALVAELAKTGWKSYKERHHGPRGGRLTYPTLEYYYNADPYWNGEYDDIGIRLDNVLKHLDYIENMPLKYRDLWENAMKCRGCRKGECPRRYVGTIFGKKGSWCYSTKPAYRGKNYCSIEDIPHIVEVARVMAEK